MTPSTVMIASAPFGAQLTAARAADAVAGGLRAGTAGAGPRSVGELDVETCQIETLPGDFEARLHRARALVLVLPTLDRGTLLARGMAFELATRARQGGVPAYAIAARDELDSFEHRILDLQAVLPARGGRGLAAAGQRLGALL
jgi:hypothetical protein